MTSVSLTNKPILYITITTVDNITTYQGLSYSHRPCIHRPCIHQVFDMQVSTRKLNSSGEREGGFPYYSPVVWNRHNANEDVDDTAEPYANISMEGRI
jgi:hypothetical protein